MVGLITTPEGSEMDDKSVLQERNELQRKAERGEISPKEYYAALKETWERMTLQERKAESVKLRCV